MLHAVLNPKTAARKRADQDQPLTYKKPDFTLRYEKCIMGNLKKQVPIWEAPSGANLEPFCEMFMAFQRTMQEWNFANNGANKFTAFSQFLSGRALHQWDVISAQVRAEDGVNNNSFIKAVKLLVEAISEPDPRDSAYEYLTATKDASNVKKRLNDDVFTHAARLQLLFFYHDLLPGTTPNLGELDDPNQVKMQKKLLFDSFPEAWQDEFLKSKALPVKDPAVTWHEILRFMSTHKSAVDRQRARKETNNVRRTRGGRGHAASRAPHGGRGANPRSHQPYPSNFQGNYQGNNQGYRYPPRYGGSNPSGRNFQGRRPGGFQGRYPSNNRNQNQRGPNQGCGPPPPPNYQNQQFQQSYHAEPHFGENSSVPEWNQGGMPSGGMPNSGMLSAGNGQPGNQNDSYYYSHGNEQDDGQQWIADEHYGYDEAPPYSFDESYHGESQW